MIAFGDQLLDIFENFGRQLVRGLVAALLLDFGLCTSRYSFGFRFFNVKKMHDGSGGKYCRCSA